MEEFAKLLKETLYNFFNQYGHFDRIELIGNSPDLDQLLDGQERIFAMEETMIYSIQIREDRTNSKIGVIIYKRPLREVFNIQGIKVKVEMEEK